MILPTVTAVSQAVLGAVPTAARDGAYALGATRWEVVAGVVVPAARSGIIGALMLGLGRALGETMAVTMVIGNRGTITLSLFALGDTMASVIANQFSEATYALYTSALIEIGLLLFAVTVLLESRRSPAGDAAWRQLRRAQSLMAANPFSTPGLRTRRIRGRFLEGLCAVAAFIGVGALLVIFIYITLQGIGAINLDFFLHTPKPVGETGGGMANAIVGTLLIVAIAAAIALPIGIGAGTYLAEYGVGRFANLVRLLSDVLTGVPSIVVGILAYQLVVLRMGHFSAIAGGVALAALMLPPIVRTTEEILRLVPWEYTEGALALGAPRWRTILTVVYPAAIGGLLTGIMLALARAAGETAPLLFTAFGNKFWNLDPMQPTAALPLQIYTYAISPYDDWHRQAWGAALVLVTIVFVLSALARFATRSRIANGR